MYKLKRVPNTETHAHGDYIVIIDDNGREVNDVGFNTQDQAFDYIKTKLENDEQYKNFISHPEIYAKDMYDVLSDYDKSIIQKSLILRYRNQCMYEYFNK